MGKEVHLIGSMPVEHAVDQAIALFPRVVIPYEQIAFFVSLSFCTFQKIRVVHRRMSGNQINKDPDPFLVCLLAEISEIPQRAKTFIHIKEVRHIIAAVPERRDIERIEPDGIESRFFNVFQFRSDPLEITGTVIVAVKKRCWIDLIDDQVTKCFLAHKNPLLSVDQFHLHYNSATCFLAKEKTPQRLVILLPAVRVCRETRSPLS